jgi:hypothetical protein
MKHLLLIFGMLGSALVPTTGYPQQPYSHCTAAFVNSKLIVNTYSPKGHCQLPGSTTGMLTVQTVALSPTATKPLRKVDFTVAIRDKATGTLHQYSSRTYRQLPVKPVLAKCKKGDRIILLTKDSQYALPHNEILVL